MAPGSPIAPNSACVPSTVGLQPRRTPSSPSKMNLDDALTVPFVTLKPEPRVLKTTPVGPLSVPTVTTSDCGVPAPLYSVERLVPLSATHHGLVEEAVSPQALTRFGSRFCAAPGTSETSRVTV